MPIEETNIEQFAITAEQMYERVIQQQPFVLVDVRASEQFNANDFMADAAFEVLSIPYIDFMDDLPAALAKLPQGRECVFICRSGAKTLIVMNLIKDQPFEKSWVAGGLGAWRNFIQRVR